MVFFALKVYISSDMLKNLHKISAKIKSLLIFVLIAIIFNSCGIYRYTDQRGQPTTAIEKARKNVEEGKAISMKGLLGTKSTNYEFSTSNPLWRASLDVLDFIPLSTVDYSGGVIISDWYSDSNSKNESIKIEIRFLSNEVRTNSIKVRVFKKNCNINLNCNTQLIDSKIKEELTKSILSKAALLEKEIKK